jgi:hypothetical protein
MWKIAWDLSGTSRYVVRKVQDDKVISLILVDNKLVGTIPNEITNLINLKYLIYTKSARRCDTCNDGELKEIIRSFFNKLFGSIPTIM